MLDDDDEHTTFEPNPWGNRQRLKPRASFLARHPALPAPAVEDDANPVRASMIVAESADASLLAAGEHTISDVVLPAASSAVMSPALSYATPLPSLATPLPMPAALILLPREIHYPEYAQPYYPPTESSNALPIASRRVRYIAVPLLSMLALVVLGGAAIEPDLELVAPAAGTVTATQEPTSAPRVKEAANEPAPPPEVEDIEPAPRIVFASRPAVKIAPRPLAKRIGKQRPVVVNTSSALGNLRPRKF